MANTVSILSYANTFGDWLVTTNAIGKEHNDLVSNNWTKSTGTIYLNDPTLGLQVATGAIFAGTLQVQGTGSTAYVQNTIRVDGQVYATNTSNSIYAVGPVTANGRINANSTGLGLYVANNATIVGTANANSIYVTTLLSSYNLTANNGIYASNGIYSSTLSVGSTANVQSLTSNTSVTTVSLSTNTATVGTGGLTVQGNFTLNGTTVYNTPRFTISANTPNQDGFIGVYRTTTANATIKWDNANTYWSIGDVSSGANNYYYKILTTQLLQNGLTDTSTANIATAYAANTLQNNIVAANTSLKSYVDNINTVIAGIDATQNTNITTANNAAWAGYARANTSSNTYIGTTGSASPSLGIVTFLSTNGVTVTGSSNTLTIATPQDLQTNASPTFASLTISAGGKPTSPTPATNTSNTMIATTAFVQNQLNNGNVYQLTANVANFSVITNDTTTNGTMYPVWVTAFGANVALKTSNTNLYFNPSTGSISATIFNALSDENKKENIVRIVDATSTIRQIDGVGFNWKDNGKKSYGHIAQKLEEILPDLVDTNAEGVKSVNYNGLVAFLVEAVKEMDKRITELENK